MPDGPALPAELQAALDEAPCGLLRTDPQGTILRVNLTFCRWVGYEREELLGRKLQELLTTGARIFHLTHLAPLMQMQGSVSEVKLEVVPRNGSAIPMVLNARRYETPQGAYSELSLFVARDRDKYERELLLARARLEKLLAEGRARQDEDRERAQIAEQMVGIVSHDLRNPLQTIQMGVLLLTKGGVSPHQLNVLGRVSRAAERSHRLIADLLDFTQARLGRGIAVHPAPIALHQAIADALDELGQAFPGRELVHEAEGEGQCVADPDRIAQLLGNLVGNAMAYGQADTPVRVRSVIGPRSFELSVHNQGAPIPTSLQANLFEPLVRGTSASSATRSVGLGLFIVSEIAKAHGGRVAVTSTEEQGTTFTATFPRGS